MDSEPTWDSLEGLLPEIKKAVGELGFERPFPVQRAVVPRFITGSQLAVESCTGSGKTLAFVLPLIQLAIKKHQKKTFSAPMTLIMVPTRELAWQICNVANSVIQKMGLNWLTVNSLTGGKAKGPQKNHKKTGEDEDEEEKKEVEVPKDGVCSVFDFGFLVATPGRMLEEIENDEPLARRKLKCIECLVIDEADRFNKDQIGVQLKMIISKLPKQRKTCLFSATLNHLNNTEIASFGLSEAIKIKIKARSNVTADLPAKLTLSALVCRTRVSKVSWVVQNLRPSEKEILFFNTCDSVDFYFKVLSAMLPGITFSKLHGQMKQSLRNNTFASFSSAKNGVLLTTDVASRGADFSNVSKIIIVDPPQKSSDLIHRVGRTARAGTDGEALLLLLPTEKAFLTELKLPCAFVGSEDFEDDCFWKKAQGIMLRDRDFFGKAQRGMVSFVRSYKEHELKNVFELDKLDPIDIARSFGLPFVPKMKDFQSGQHIVDEEYFKKFQISKFADKNQALQIEENRKIQAEARERKNEEIRQKQKKAEKEATMIKKRSYSDRKKAKIREYNREMEEFNFEERLAKKVKRGTMSKAEFEQILDRKYSKLERNHD